MGKMRPMKPGGPVFRPKPPMPRPQIISPRPMAPRPLIAPRPAIVVPQRGASMNRVVAREIRRDAFKQMANQQQAQPRFDVRPVTPPLKVMPRQQAPLRPGIRPAIMPPQSPTGMAKIAQKPTPTVVHPPAPGAKVAAKAQITPPPAGIQHPVVSAGTVGAVLGAAALGALVLNTATAHPQISSEANSLNYSLEDLKSRSSLGQIQAELTELDAALSHALNLLESARKEGYVYQKDLDEFAYQAMDQWQGIKQQVLASIPQQAAAFQNRMYPLGSQVASLNSVLGNPTAAAPLLGNTSSQVNTLLSDLSQMESSLENSYADIKNQTANITSRLNVIHWAMDQLGQAKFKLGESENLIMAVQARWDQEGDQDPEGILFLSNKRIIFERKEKVATKKILFITTSQELVQEVFIDQVIENISNVKAVNKGLFGNQDFLEIQFNEAKLGNVPFHLNGQDCTQWASWIQKARSHDIEDERTTGSGLSYADLTGPLTAADLVALQSEVNALQDVVTLKTIREELGKIENDMRTLERTLASLRSRGYNIEKNLEADVAILATQWDRIKSNAGNALQNQTRLLSDQMTSIQVNMSVLAGKSTNLNEARPIYLQVKSAIASAEAQADAADDAVIATYDQYADEVESMSAHMEWIGWMLDAISTASFQLMATESGVAATEAIWDRPGLEPENGILFLTDQRLLWEDRVDAFELKFNQPLQQVSDVRKEVDIAKGQEFLMFGLSAGGPYSAVRFILALPVADAWLKMVGRARSGDYAKDRAVEIDPAELERIRNAPRQCSNCGAGLTAPILRGQTEITCEYCGQVTRI